MAKKIRKKAVLKSEKKASDFLEITQGEMYIKIPKDVNSVCIVQNILEAYRKELEKRIINIPEKVEELKEQDEKIDIEVPEIPEPEGIPTECPLCKSKIKVSSPKKIGENLVQVVRCKKNVWYMRKCDFKKEYAFKI